MISIFIRYLVVKLVTFLTSNLELVTFLFQMHLNLSPLFLFLAFRAAHQLQWAFVNMVFHLTFRYLLI